MSQLAGIELNGVIMNASGANCRTEFHLRKQWKSDSCAVVTKSSTPLCREGNPTPRYYGIKMENGKSVSINSMGIPNEGYKFYERMGGVLKSEYPNPRKLYIQSVSGLKWKDNLDMLCDLQSSESVDAVELNVSFPNIIGKPQLGYDFEGLEECLRKVGEGEVWETKIPLGLKLPPYFDMVHFDRVADILLENGMFSFVTCCNSFGNGMYVDWESESTVIKPKNGFGGVGGANLKPTSLANVHKFYTLFGDKIDVIGCGGISSGIDVFEYILAGARCVQVGTHLVENAQINEFNGGYGVFTTLNEEFHDVLVCRNYTSVDDFRGNLKYL